MDRDVLDVHSEGALGEIDGSASPGAGSCGGGIRLGCFAGTSDPASHLDQHGGLGIVLSAYSLFVVIKECTDGDSVDVPDGGLGGPVNGVVMEGVNRCSDCWVLSTVIGRRVSLSEEVVLGLGVVGTEPFPINLIEIVGFENKTTDDTSSG